MTSIKKQHGKHLNNPVAIKMIKWLDNRRNKNGMVKDEFTLQTLMDSLKFHYKNVDERNAVRQTIYYMREMVIDGWKQWTPNKKDSMVKQWREYLKYCNNHGVYYLACESNGREKGKYFQPNYHKKERLDQWRVIRPAKAVTTILEELDLLKERLLRTDEVPSKALVGFRHDTKKYLTNSTFKEEK